MVAQRAIAATKSRTLSPRGFPRLPAKAAGSSENQIAPLHTHTNNEQQRPSVCVRGGGDMDTTSDDGAADQDTESDFQIVSSRKKKRQLANTSPQLPSNQLYSVKAAMQSVGQPVAAAETRQAAARPPKRRTLVGESTSCALRAATNLQLKKKVLKVGNLNEDCDEDDVKEHVESLGVRVVSCFLLRRQPWQPAGNNCFRLCIFATDTHKLLVKGAWSSGVVIQDWIHRPN